MKKPITLKFYSDPGHGWLAVKISFLEKIGLHTYDFSVCSYRKGSTVYLEEDCDAVIFMKRLKESFMSDEYGIVFKNTDRRSPIRSYPSIHS